MDLEMIKIFNLYYAKQLYDAIEQVMPKLIQAFINVYGKSHADYIRDRLQNIVYTFTISKSFLNRGVILDDNNEEDTYIKDLYNRYVSYLESKRKNLSDEEDRDFTIKNYKVFSEFDDEWFLDSSLFDALKDDCPLVTNFFYQMEEDAPSCIGKAVFLPIITINFYILVHELNHALANDSYLLTHEDKFLETDFFMGGDGEYYEESEELINDFIAGNVIREFQRIGGVVPDALKRYNFNQSYQANDFLVEYFYNSLEPLILKGYISGNHNIRNIVGEDNWMLVMKLINSLFHKEDIYPEDVIPLIDMVGLMRVKFLTHNVSDNKSFIRELKLKGVKLKSTL